MCVCVCGFYLNVEKTNSGLVLSPRNFRVSLLAENNMELWTKPV